MARLAALVPNPHVNLTRYHGVFAPNHHLREQVRPARRGRRHSTRAEEPPANPHASMSLKPNASGKINQIGHTVLRLCRMPQSIKAQAKQTDVMAWAILTSVLPTAQPVSGRKRSVSASCRIPTKPPKNSIS